MPRIRTIKPEFWTDEKVGMLSANAKLLLIGMLTHSDDYGVVRGNPLLLKSQIFPYEQNLRADDFKKHLDALVDARMIIPFEIRKESYFYIRTFRSHQLVERPSKTRNCSEEELIQSLEKIGYIFVEDIPQHSPNNERIFAEHSKSTHQVVTEHSENTHRTLTEYSESTHQHEDEYSQNTHRILTEHSPLEKDKEKEKEGERENVSADAENSHTEFSKKINSKKKPAPTILTLADIQKYCENEMFSASERVRARNLLITQWITQHITNENFVYAWDKYSEMRTNTKPLTYEGGKDAIQQLMKHSLEDAMTLLEMSTAHKWQGFVEERLASKKNQTTNQNGKNYQNSNKRSVFRNPSDDEY